MVHDDRRIGAHLPLGGGMVKAADRAHEIGATAIQVFSDNPTSWHRRPELPGELPAFRTRLTELDIAPLAIHAPYLVNLAGGDDAFVERSVAVLVNELRVAAAYGAVFVNIHVGSHRGQGVELGCARVADGLRRVLDRVDEAAAGVTIILENGSGGGFGLGATIEELALVDREAKRAGVDPARYGFCLDAAHLWGAGYPIDRPAGVDAVVAAFDRAIGLDRLRMVHLNDSRSELGSRSDRHEHVGAGRIGAAGLRHLLTHPALGHVTCILETPGMDEGYDAINLARVRDLLAGRPLADLPPEAFETRSAKGRSAPPEAVPADRPPAIVPGRAGA